MMRAGVLCVVLLAGCLSQPRTPEPARYDLGIAPVAGALHPASKAMPAVTRLKVAARSWLDDTAMHYRLMYVDEMRTLAYAYAQWIASPAELIQQRLRQSLGESGTASTTGAARELEIELEEFVQVFETPTQSFGRIAVEVRLRATDASIETASFSEQVAAPTPDAAGGVRALAAATDALVARIADWIGARGNRSSRTDLRLTAPQGVPTTSQDTTSEAAVFEMRRSSLGGQDANELSSQ
jgi:cholesterol transport system auxiliary component